MFILFNLKWSQYFFYSKLYRVSKESTMWAIMLSMQRHGPTTVKIYYVLTVYSKIEWKFLISFKS